MIDSALYFEQDDLWNRDFGKDPFWVQKAQIMTAMIPPGVRTILDVGCGNGALTNLLAKAYTVCGIDRSRAALRHVIGRRVCGGVDQMPLKDAAFDLVLCSEVLEHLPDETYQKTIDEIKRASARYILLSVPFQEHFRFRLMQCPRCRHVFHVWGHVRRFDLRTIPHIFSEYRMTTWTHCGVQSRDYHPAFLAIRQHVGGTWFDGADSHPLCPRCGNAEFPGRDEGFVSRLCDELNARFGRRTTTTPYWLVALLDDQ